MENTKREIRFRAWNVKKKRMSYQDGTGKQPLILRIDGVLAQMGRKSVDKYEYAYEHNVFVTDEEGGQYHTDDFVLMQYTGLLDKNGKEIWEGDIVNATGYGLIETTFMSKIVFEKGCFGIVALESPALIDCKIGESFRGFEGCNTEKLIEVIGNIYENPNLLSEKE